MLRRLCGPTDSVITQSINTLRNFFPPGPTIKAFSSHLLQSPLSELAYGAVSFHAVPVIQVDHSYISQCRHKPICTCISWGYSQSLSWYVRARPSHSVWFSRLVFSSCRRLRMRLWLRTYWDEKVKYFRFTILIVSINDLHLFQTSRHRLFSYFCHSSLPRRRDSYYQTHRRHITLQVGESHATEPWNTIVVSATQR